jgi:uncharacterized lipoprotein
MNSTKRASLLVAAASLAIVVSSTGCSWMKSKTHYKESREMSPLEVPPDLDAPDTSSATSLPVSGGAGTPAAAPSSAGAGHLAVSVAEAYPKVGELLAATPGVTINGRTDALSSYDVMYKGDSFLLRVLDSTGGSRMVALSPDGRMLTTGAAAELIASLKSRF